MNIQTVHPSGQIITTQPAFTTAVITQQPPTSRPWQSGICDCCDDIQSCCCTYWCQNCYFACLATRMGESCCVGLCGGGNNGCVPGGHMAMRSRFRATHGIKGDICSDCCEVTFCLPCAMCQLKREMDHLNYPPGAC